MNILDTDAIILHTRDFGESDRIVTFLARRGGKLSGIAKGARRSRKRFAHSFEPGSLVELRYRDRRSLVFVEACKLLEPHLALRTDVERWGYAALISEIVLEMVPEGETQEETFLLLDETLRQLIADRDPLNVVLVFALRFLGIVGYLPPLESCCVCGRPLQSATRWWWGMDQGSLCCSEHGPDHDGCISLDLGTLALVRQLRRLPLDRIWRLRLQREKKVPLLKGMTGWVRRHIHKDLKSLKMIEQVQTIQAGWPTANDPGKIQGDLPV